MLIHVFYDLYITRDMFHFRVLLALKYITPVWLLGIIHIRTETFHGNGQNSPQLKPDPKYEEHNDLLTDKQGESCQVTVPTGISW